MYLSHLADHNVLTASGQKVCFGSLWQERPAVLALVRHFG